MMSPAHTEHFNLRLYGLHSPWGVLHITTLQHQHNMRCFDTNGRRGPAPHLRTPEYWRQLIINTFK